MRDREEILEKKVFESLGAASTCWESMEGTGVFDSERANAIGEDLLAHIRHYARMVATEAIANSHGGKLKTKETHPEEFHEDGYPIEEMGT